MSSRPFLVLAACAVLAAPSSSAADALDDAAIQAAPQYYLMSLPDAPVGEIADAVLGEALGLPFKVDPDINTTMSFQIDGLYSPKALAQEFGYRLWNADIALVDRPSGGLWLIPKAKLTVALTEGAVLVSPPVGTPARQQAPPPAVSEAKAVARASPPGLWFAWLAAGWAMGAGTVMGWNRLRRRRSSATSLLIGPAPITPDNDDADDLIIPIFPSTTVKLKL